MSNLVDYSIAFRCPGCKSIHGLTITTGIKISGGTIAVICADCGLDGDLKWKASEFAAVE